MLITQCKVLCCPAYISIKSEARGVSSAVKKDSLEYVKSSWKGFEIYRFSHSLTQNVFPRPTRNKIISVLSSFKDILLASIQLVKFFKSLFNILFSFLIEWLIYNKFVSSTKWWTLQYLIARSRSLMYKRNYKGPKTDPCGTSVGIDAHSEL